LLGSIAGIAIILLEFVFSTISAAVSRILSFMAALVLFGGFCWYMYSWPGFFHWYHSLSFSPPMWYAFIITILVFLSLFLLQG